MQEVPLRLGARASCDLEMAMAARETERALPLPPGRFDRGWTFLRLALLLSTSYIHPDEFFQSLEIFDPKGFVPWEFSPVAPIRSWMHPVVFGWLPLSIALSNGFLALLFSRALLFLLGFVFEAAIHAATRTASLQTAGLSLFLCRSSWAWLAMTSRGFSNTFEAVLFSSLIWLCCRSSAEKPVRDHPLLSIGFVCAMGLFCRFTFIFFAFPCVLWLLCLRWAGAGWRRTADDILTLTAGFGVGFVANVLADSWAFHRTSGLWVCCPLNNALYNVDAANLAVHGLHPRYLHVLVNGPLLFGPVFLFAAWAVAKSLRVQLPVTASYWPSAVVVFALAALSAAPHQEPRFLLPLLVPLSLLAGRLRLPRAVRAATVILQLALCIVFGFLVHGGVLPAALSSRSSRVVIFHNTMMPPRFLLPADAQVVDTQGTGLDPWIARFCSSSPSLRLVSPLVPGEVQRYCADGRATFRWPHLDFDRMSEVDYGLLISACQVDCQRAVAA